ncbi:FepC ABC-type cobalamin/Fe3+-siderophores transport systems, ATPase components [Rhabdaerophilaceae bacterium]
MMEGTVDLADVSVALGGKPVVRNVRLTLEPGRLVVLAGPNGAGKTTLLRAIAGLVSASGVIRIGAKSLAAMSRPERARAMAYLPQGHQVHWPLTARDVVALGRFPHGLSDPAWPDTRHQSAIDSAMARTETCAIATRNIVDLSGGERARVMLARVLAVEAPILLADEPTASLDPRYQLTVMNDLKKESQRGALVLVVTHDIWLASRLADDIVLMHHGSVLAHGAPDAVLTDSRLAEVYGITVHRHCVDRESWIAPRGLT